MTTENTGDGGPEPRRRGRKQPELPAMKGVGVEKPVVPAIDEAAVLWQSLKDKAAKLSEREEEAKKALLGLMHKHGLNRYEFDDWVVTVEPKEEPESIKMRPRARYKAAEAGAVPEE